MRAPSLAPVRTRVDPEASDDELVIATRAGDSSAYGALWDRHSPAALRAARSITSSIDADDLVSEAFAKTLSAIRNGGGPTDAFRPYIFAAVRSAAATWGGKQKDVALEYIDELPVDDSDDSLDLLSDKALLTAAFKEMPERWRTLLWYLEVEGMKPREIAPLMGMTPNAVSVLAARAREGFKIAWLHAHISEPGRGAECRWTCERIVAQGRRRHIPRVDRSRFDAHLESCRRCAMASTEVVQASSKLRAVLLPAIIGGPAAAAYSAASPVPAMAAVASGVLPRGGAPWLIAGGSAAAVTVAVAVVAVAAQLAPVAPPVADEASSSALVIESPTPISTPEPHGTPVVPPAPVPTPDLVPEPRPESERDSEPVPVADPVADPVVAPAPPQEAAPPAAPAEPRTQPSGTPPAAPIAEQPIDRPLTVSWVVPASSVVPPPITGTGTAGSRVEIVDEAGRIIATALVDARGTFSVRPDADALHQGMSITLRQTAPSTGEQTSSEPVGPVVFDAPELADESDGFVRRTDADGDGSIDDVDLALVGLAGATVVVTVDGGTESRVTLTEEPTVMSILDVHPGIHRIIVRYVDPVTGALGVAEAESILVVP